MLFGNKGEWSEVYVLLRLLADGKIYAANGELNRIDDIYFPILEIYRKESINKINKYSIKDFPKNDSDGIVEIFINDKKVKSIDRNRFSKESSLLLDRIKSSTGSTFAIPQSQSFIDEILCKKLAAPSEDKTDISMTIVDIHTGYTPLVGFSIKSELGSHPTLLNAGKTTNFIFKIISKDYGLLKTVNSIYKKQGNKEHIDVTGRVKKIIECKSTFEYSEMQNETFKDNLILIDSKLDKILAETILYYYRDGITNCVDMVNKLKEENPMNYSNKNAYSYKFKKMLSAIALGMRPSYEWDGIDEASGGYIVVNKKGDVLAYHIYNRNYFEEYLLNNTKYETASTTRHDFGKVYEENGINFIKLNLQIRFK